MVAGGIRILALGSGAGHALNRMVRAGAIDATPIAANTDAQDLKRSAASVRFLLGQKLTKGLGASGDAETGRDAVAGDRAELAALLNDTAVVIVIAALGGGTGSGAAPVVVDVAGQAGALVVAVVTKPWPFEGRRRRRVADEGFAELTKVSDLVVVAHDATRVEPMPGRPMRDAFADSDVAVAATVADLMNELKRVPGDRASLEVAARAWVGTRDSTAPGV
jgi:cell division protein FtsZ